MKKFIKNFIIVILIFFALSAIFALLNPEPFKKTSKISISKLIQDINNDEIKKIDVSDSEIHSFYKSGKEAVTIKESGTSVPLPESLETYGAKPEKLSKIDINIKKESRNASDWIFSIIFLILPLFLFGWFFWMIFKQAKSGASQTFSFLKAPTKIFTNGKAPGEKVTFKDVAGLEEAKEEVKEVVDFLKNPKKFWKMGARIPRGVLLIGPPGTGKTLLARAVANESQVPFFSMSGSEFIELFVGVGASRVRSLFETAKKHQPSIIFIDEIDSIGKIRMPGIGGGHEEREQTLNQILAEMDGFERNAGVIVIGATNAPQYLDPALLRPGRFDRRIILDLPDINGRTEILKIHCRQKPLALNVNLKEVAERTPGFSGADLANLVNEAAILAARRNKKEIYQEEFFESIEKVLLGPERKSHLLSNEEKKVSAFHEAGHALVATFLPEASKVKKISIIARGMAAGYTLSLPKEEKKMKTKSEFLAEIAVLLGGYCAEKTKFKEVSTGASNDLERASILARNLVTKYGMSKLGPISFGKRESLPFLGIETETERNYSEKIATQIDKETKRFIEIAQKTAMDILKRKKDVLEKIANRLIEKETIEKDEFEKLVKAKSITSKKQKKKGQKTKEKNKRIIKKIQIKNFDKN
ncbi:ATP-dependent zinc metalloprotease FtsH [bacterium]|nr:ATP-dependent zinc metalloprotease FtsH [bacterium]